jgi:transcriptional regulator with XRE-family HTH domain
MENSNNYEKVVSTSDRLREAMTDAGKKQADLARETGLDTGLISRYVAGTYEPKARAIGMLARALDVSEMWLWGYDVPKARADWQKKNDEIVNLVAKLRGDPDFLDVVSVLAKLPADQYASIKQLISALGNK